MLTYGGTPAMDSCGNPIYKGAIVNPATTVGGAFGCVFVNNQIPTSLISTKTAQILEFYHEYYKPESSLTANDAANAYSPDPWFHNTQSSVKMDYNLSAKQHINGSFYWDDYPRINADQGGVWSAAAPDGGPMANSYWHNTTAPGARLSDTYTISPNLSNTVYATFNRFRNPSIAVPQAGKRDSALGLLHGAGNFPLIYFHSGMYFGGANYQNGWNFSPLGSQYNDYYAGNTFIYSDELVWSHGRHNLKFGTEFRVIQFNYHTDVGTFTGGYPIIFDPTTTAPAWYDFNAYDQIGNAFASFLLGDVYKAENNNPDNEYGRRKAFSLYASDDIRVNPKLTVDLSLRWDYNNPYKEKYGRRKNAVSEATLTRASETESFSLSTSARSVRSKQPRGSPIQVSCRAGQRPIWITLSAITLSPTQRCMPWNPRYKQRRIPCLRFSALMRPSHPVRHRCPRRNQRCR